LKAPFIRIIIKIKGLNMKRVLFLDVIVVSMMLAACQVNNVRDTGGGAVSPSSTVTGVTLGSETDGNP
jgi:predicted small secreted protein